MSELLIASLALPDRSGRFAGQVWVTPVSATLGEEGPNFGIAPGRAEVGITLRANRQEDLDRLKEDLVEMAGQMAGADALDMMLSWHEEFPATVNHEVAVRSIVTAAESEGLSTSEIETPFRWSEDFCYYTKAYPGAFFGIGSGEDTPQLHHQHYDFPDELIPTGIRIFARIAHDIVGVSGIFGQEG
ncbi:MAG: M20/M25/M40 family metallo-hydrolase [Pseudomonadales bacterium]|nr:M20/M25/M40 family metallo-hydrolase [Pseudomonadales bacterium]